MTAHAHPRASRVVLGDGSPLTRRASFFAECPGNGAVSERAVREGETRADVAPPACMVRRGAFSTVMHEQEAQEADAPRSPEGAAVQVPTCRQEQPEEGRPRSEWQRLLGAVTIFAAAGPVRRGAVAQAHLAGDRNPAFNRTLVGATSAGSIPATLETAGWCDTAVTAGRDRRFLRVAHGSSFADSRPDSGIRITKVGSIPAPKTRALRWDSAASGWGPPLSMRPPFPLAPRGHQ